MFLPVPLHLPPNKILLRPLAPQDHSPPPPSMDLRFSSSFFLSPIPPDSPPAPYPSIDVTFSYPTQVEFSSLYFSHQYVKYFSFFPALISPTSLIIQFPLTGLTFRQVCMYLTEQEPLTSLPTLSPELSLKPCLTLESGQHSVMLIQTLNAMCLAHAWRSINAE